MQRILRFGRYATAKTGQNLNPTIPLQSGKILGKLRLALRKLKLKHSSKSHDAQRAITIHTYRSDIRDKTTLDENSRLKFEELNRVNLTDSEFARLRDEIVNADVYIAAKTLCECNTFQREIGTPLKAHKKGLS